MDAYPNILAWLERLEARPAFRRAEEKGGYFGAAKP
jgi:glutathione S-transferase